MFSRSKIEKSHRLPASDRENRHFSVNGFLEMQAFRSLNLQFGCHLHLFEMGRASCNSLWLCCAGKFLKVQVRCKLLCYPQTLSCRYGADRNALQISHQVHLPMVLPWLQGANLQLFVSTPLSCLFLCRSLVISRSLIRKHGWKLFGSHP